MSCEVRSANLARRARELVESLGGEWRRWKGMCRCPAHADRTPSLSVTLGRRAILLHCFAGCPNHAVIAALARCGVRPRELFDGVGGPLPGPPRKASPDRNACRLWRTAAPLTGSLIETYLAGRGISRYSPDLRFHPRTPLGPRDAVRFLPAMLAAVRTDLGVIAVHRTFLEPDSGLARFSRPKRSLGRLQHGAVRLAPPWSGRLGLAEGIETALSATQLTGLPCWATLGNERFGLVSIPEGVRELHLFLDNDAGGDLAEARARAAHAQADRHIVARRPVASDEDWNDLLMRRAKPTARPDQRRGCARILEARIREEASSGGPMSSSSPVLAFLAQPSRRSFARLAAWRASSKRARPFRGRG